MTNRFAQLQEWTENFFTKVILVILYGLTIFSVLVLVILLFEGVADISKSGFDFSSNGIVNFISHFTPFQEVLGSTVAIIGLYMVIRQIQVMSITNKISNWIDWRDKFKELLKQEIAPSNHSYMVRYFEVYGEDMHDYLFRTNMKLNNKEHLTEFFNKFIAKGVADFEQKTQTFMTDKTNNVLYQNVTCYSYFNYFNKISEYVARPTIDYTEISDDLKNLYFDEVNRFRQRENL